ncbi:MAG: DNA repair protein RadC [Peptococcaceae bacterium]|jgi:DNA repair protein RadC|nr:DNA repair protein RadC [Peptococcaceae bacterium]
MSYRLKDMPEELFPRERLLHYGSESLSNGEILAIILRTGVKGENVLNLAERILSESGGITGLAKLSVHEMMQVSGLGKAKAAGLKAALELGKRAAATDPQARPVIRTPQDAAGLVMEEMRYLDREHFRVMTLNVKNHVLGISPISIGSLNESLVHPRECFKEAIRRNAHAIILLHNHPSGDPAPSQEDRNVTRRLMEGGKLLGIQVIDHIIIGDNRYISLKAEGLCE